MTARQLETCERGQRARLFDVRAAVGLADAVAPALLHRERDARRAGARLRVDRQRRGRAPLRQQRRRRRAVDHQQILAARERGDFARPRELHAQRREAGPLPHVAEHRQIRFELLRRRPVGHHDGGLRQIGEAREREPAVREVRQIRQLRVVDEVREVDRRIGVDRRALRLERRARAQRRLLRIEREAQLQLVAAADPERRNVDVARHAPFRHRQQRQLHAAARVFRMGRREPVRLHELVVDLDGQRRVVLHARRRVAIAQRDRHAGAVPRMQIGRHVQVQADRVRRRAAHFQLARVRHEFAERDRPVDRQPARRVVRLARRAEIDVRDGRGRARQRRAAEHERPDRVVDFGRRAAGHDQQLAPGSGRVVGDGEQRAVDRRQREAGRQRRGRADHDRLVVGRQRRRDREARLPVIGQRTEPRREHAGTAQRRRVGRRRQHERQPQAAVVTPVEERRGQQRQIVRQAHRRFVEDQLAGRAHVGPQRRVRRVFAMIERVMRDQAQADLVEIGEVARIDRDVLRDHAARARRVERHGRDDLAVHQHLQMRHRKHQRRRIRVGQAQPRAGHHAIEPHARVDRARIVGAAQMQRVERAERRERQTHGDGRPAGRGGGRAGRARCGGNLWRARNIGGRGRGAGNRRHDRPGRRPRRDRHRRGGQRGGMQCAEQRSGQHEQRRGRPHARPRIVSNVR